MWPPGRPTPRNRTDPFKAQVSVPASRPGLHCRMHCHRSLGSWSGMKLRQLLHLLLGLCWLVHCMSLHVIAHKVSAGIGVAKTAKPTLPTMLHFQPCSTRQVLFALPICSRFCSVASHTQAAGECLALGRAKVQLGQTLCTLVRSVASALRAKKL